MKGFDLFLFSTDPETVSRYTEAGVDGFIVDWESKGKEDTAGRSRHGDQRRHAGGPPAGAGRDERPAPLPSEPARSVDARRDRRGGRRRCGRSPASNGAKPRGSPRRDGGREGPLRGRNPGRDGRRRPLRPGLARLPISRAYVGLNDLSIERKSRSIFEPLTDGLVDAIRPLFTVPFGLAGLTLPECGRPIPCRLLIGEMAAARAASPSCAGPGGATWRDAIRVARSLGSRPRSNAPDGEAPRRSPGIVRSWSRPSRPPPAATRDRERSLTGAGASGAPETGREVSVVLPVYRNRIDARRAAPEAVRRRSPDRSLLTS